MARGGSSEPGSAAETCTPVGLRVSDRDEGSVPITLRRASVERSSHHHRRGSSSQRSITFPVSLISGILAG